MSAGLADSTVKPGRPAPDVSFTTPAMLACANAVAGIDEMRRIQQANRVSFASTRIFCTLSCSTECPRVTTRRRALADERRMIRQEPNFVDAGTASGSRYGLPSRPSFSLKGPFMDARRVVLRCFVVVVVIAAAAAYFSRTEPVRGIDLGASRLLSSEPMREAMMESCSWDVATPERVAFQRGGGGIAPGPAMGDPQVA